MGLDLLKCVRPIVIYVGKLLVELSTQQQRHCKRQALLITSGNFGHEVQLLFGVLCQMSGVSPAPADRCLYQSAAIFGTDCHSYQKASG